MRYILKEVLPFIEKHYPVLATRAGRLLLGFSKSGWFSLLLRNPSVFEKAAAWDAPLMMALPNKYGMAEIFGDQKNFEKYQLSRLLEARAKELGKEPGWRSWATAIFAHIISRHTRSCKSLASRMSIATPSSRRTRGIRDGWTSRCGG